MQQSNLTPPSTSDVKIGRLERKLEKVKKQRDHYKKLCEHYAEVLTKHPHIKTRYNSYNEMIKERERVRALEKRVKEQEQLITLLNKPS